MCLCKWRLWQSDLTNSLVVGMENVTNYLLVCWHLAKMRNTILHPLPVIQGQQNKTLCVGHEVDRRRMIRNRYSQIAHPALNIKWKRTPTMKTAPKQKQHKRKARGTALSKAKEYSKSEGKQRVGPMTNFCK